MPRNPNKLPCQAPGCRAWAMRGHTHCRAHRDAELGPRGGGASPGNLNALKTGDHAHPLPSPGLRRLAHQLVSDPHGLPHHLGLQLRSLHSRTQDPLKTLLALRALILDLLPLVADGLFVAELDAFLQQLPPSERDRVRIVVWKQALRLGPELKLRFLRQLIPAIEEKFMVRKNNTSGAASPPGRGD